MDAAITIRDFSGGLNTSTEESRIPPSMTSDMLNCSITDSRGFARRKGYQAISVGQVTATAHIAQLTATTKYTAPAIGATTWTAEAVQVSATAGTEVTLTKALLPSQSAHSFKQTFTLAAPTRVRGITVKIRGTAGGTMTMALNGTDTAVVATSGSTQELRVNFDKYLAAGSHNFEVTVSGNTYYVYRDTAAGYTGGVGQIMTTDGSFTNGDGTDTTIDWWFQIHGELPLTQHRVWQTLETTENVLNIESVAGKFDIDIAGEVTMTVYDEAESVVTTAARTVSPTDGMVTFSPPALTSTIGAGQTLRLEFQYTGSAGGSIYRNTANPYAGGSFGYYNSGGTRVPVSGSDMAFDVYYETSSGVMEAKSVYRHHTGAGGKYWVALFGTMVTVAQDSAATDSYGLVQVESLSATSATYSAPKLSGGSAVQLTATGVTYTVPVPYSSYISTRFYGTGLESQLDGGSWVAATGASITHTGLTATTHTLVLRATATRNDKSLKLAPAGDLKYRERKRAFSDVDNTMYEVSFYDDGTSTNKDILVKLYIAGAIYQVGVYKSKSTTYYCYLEGGNLNSTKITAIKRSAGWHTWRFFIDRDTRGTRLRLNVGTLDGVSLDEKVVREQIVEGSYFTMGLYCRSRTSGTVTAYFDEVRCNHAMVEDFENLTAWTAHGDAANTDAVSTEQKTTGERCLIDTVEYRADAGWTRIAGVSASADRLACTSMNGKLYFGTRYDALRTWNGATVATITASGTAPAADFLMQKQSRIFAAGKHTDRGILEYTAVDSGTNWTGGGALRPIGVNSGQNCMGLAKWNDAMFFFTENRTRVIAIEGDEVNWVNKELSDKVGCIAPDSIASGPNAIMFLSNSGIRAYGLIQGVNDSDGSGFLLLSEIISGTLRRITESAIHKAQGAFFDNKYFLSLPLDGSTVNNYTLVYRFPEAGQRGAWMLYDYGFRCLYVTRGDEEGLYGGGYDGNVYRLEYGATDAGNPIRMRYRIPPVTDKTGYSVSKTWRRMHLTAESDALQTVTITPYTDFVSGQPVTVDVTDMTDTQPIRKPMSARGRSIGADIVSSGSEQNLTISEVSFTYVPGRMR